jgi:hypothetical protein
LPPSKSSWNLSRIDGKPMVFLPWKKWKGSIKVHKKTILDHSRMVPSFPKHAKVANITIVFLQPKINIPGWFYTSIGPFLRVNRSILGDKKHQKTLQCHHGLMSLVIHHWKISGWNQHHLKANWSGLINKSSPAKPRKVGITPKHGYQPESCRMLPAPGTLGDGY